MDSLIYGFPEDDVLTSFLHDDASFFVFISYYDCYFFLFILFIFLIFSSLPIIITVLT